MAALLFDLDGTLLNSDPIHVVVYKDLWADRGLVMDDAFYMRHVHGRLNVDVFAEFLPDEPDPQGLSDWKEAQYRDRLPRPYPSIPGAADLVAQAGTEGWQIAVVTNAMRLNAEASLTAIGLRPKFDTIIIGEECPRGKPDPFPYLEAMRQLGEQPETCIAFEDSPSGLRAARAADVFTIGIRSGLDDATLRAAGAHITIQDFTDPALPALLERLKGVPA